MNASAQAIQPVSDERATANARRTSGTPPRFARTYYGELGLHPAASAIEIRRAYRALSKRYHPDTTNLPLETANAKFRQLNQAYATLSNPERRRRYDLQIGYARAPVIQSPPHFDRARGRAGQRPQGSPAYLEATERPLSAGEVFVLFVLGVAFLGCLLLAIGLGLTRGEAALQMPQLRSNAGSAQASVQLTLPAQSLWQRN